MCIRIDCENVKNDRQRVSQVVLQLPVASRSKSSDRPEAETGLVKSKVTL